MATQQNLDLAQQLYVAYYGRPADSAGLQYWGDQIESQGGAGAVVNAFGTSSEFNDAFGDMNSDQLVNNLYQQMFGRDAEIAGLDYYTNQLQSGSMQLPEIALAIANGAQGDDATALDNKVAVANDFTSAIDTTDERLAYSGTNAASDARNFLATVDANTDTSSVDANSELQQIVTNNPANTGSTSNLTAGVDNLTGTGDNDVFNALPVNTSDGAAATTLNGFDSIDGGAGQDTLNIYTTNADNTSLPSGATVQNIEIVNVHNSADAADFGDASQFSGIEQLWQIDSAEAVTNLATGTTAGFRNTDQALNVTAAAAASSAVISLDDVVADSGLTVSGDALNNVTVNGSLSSDDTDGVAMTVHGAGNTLTLNTAVDASSLAADSAVRTVNAGQSTGDISFDAADGTGVTSITTGSGDDTITYGGDLTSIDGGAGDDTVELSGTDFSTQAYDTANDFQNIENLVFTDANATVDASQLSGYDTLTFQENGSEVDNLSANQTVAFDGGTGGGGTQTLTIGGDIASSVNVDASYDAGTTDSPNTANTVTVTVDGDEDVTGSTLNLTGNSNVTFDNDTGNDSTGTFSSVDASELSGDLDYTTDSDTAETITLGSGSDTLNVAAGSTYGNMDTITGFDSSVSDNDDVSDNLTDIFGDGDSATEVTGDFSSLSEGFAAAADAGSDEYSFFQFGGNTYVFNDNTGDNDDQGADIGNGEYDNNDFAIELMGVHDLSSGNDAAVA